MADLQDYKEITNSAFNRKPKDYWRNKKAMVICDQANIGGKEIPKGAEVIITARCDKDTYGLDIKDPVTGVEISRVWFRDVYLKKKQ